MKTNNAAKSNKPVPTQINGAGDKVWQLASGGVVVTFADRANGDFSVTETVKLSASERQHRGCGLGFSLLATDRVEGRKIWADRQARGWVLLSAD